MLRALALLLLFSTNAQSSPSEDTCAYNIIFYEANGESLDGQRSVLDVVLNRARSEKKSLCKIMSAPYQFSWYGVKPLKKLDTAHLNKVKWHSPVLLNNEKWFFRRELSPSWARKLKCSIIENHKFCRERNEKDAYSNKNH